MPDTHLFPTQGKQTLRSRPTMLEIAGPRDQWLSVRREKAWFFSGCKSHPAKVAPAGSYRSDGGGNETVEAFETTRR
jgi:hypothetical protein